MFKHFALYTAFLCIIGVGGAKAASVLTLSPQFTDSTVVELESMETNVTKMMENWYLQNYVQLDRNADNSVSGDVTDEVIIQRLAAMPTKIEMPYNEIVRSYIDMYTQRRRQLVENMLGMSLYYMPIFEVALEREGVPLELKYLPIIESALNPDAVSRAGAAGLWQFMPPTAREQGLELNSLVDERRDPHKSSAKAARYLRQLYEMFGDWSLAIASYNCGPGNVAKALKRAGEGDGRKRDFWDIYHYLPNETRGYFPCFIAANYVMTYYPEHNISPALARRPLITDSVLVTHGVHFQQIADVLNLPIEEIRALNPQYREDYIPGDGHPYSLVLPSKQIYSYIMSEDSILSYHRDEFNKRKVVDPNSGEVVSVSDNGNTITVEKTLWHKVKRGETLTTISKKYGVSVAELKKANGGIGSVKRGQTIKIIKKEVQKRPQEETEAETAEIDNATEETDFNGNEVVTDSQENNEQAVANEDPVKEGAKPSAPASPKKNVTEPSKPATKTITVRKGDTLSSIARANGTTVAKIKQLNGLKNDNIFAGQKLRVK